MKRVKGFLKLCERCGLEHDSEGAAEGRCAAWFGSIGGPHGVVKARWQDLLEAIG